MLKMKNAVYTAFLAVASMIFISQPVMALDYSISGFGTIGYSQSDQPYKYYRYIDDNGTFFKDSVVAFQIDTAMTSEWSTTVQLKFAPDLGDDSRWEPSISWGFVSWRPTNDWLFRIGKMRLPGYLNSENMDVGTTFDYARLPIELYSVSPTYDYIGASFNKTFELEDDSLILDGYWGKRNTEWRIYLRDGIPGILPSGPQFFSIQAELMGMALTYRRDEDIYRLGFHKIWAERTDGQSWSEEPPLINLTPEISYYDFQQVVNSSGNDTLDISMLNIGTDIAFGNNVHLSGEYIYSSVSGGGSSTGGYISPRIRLGKWTPYILYSRLRSDDESLALYEAVNNSSVPMFIPGAAIINASQRAGADSFQAYDQSSYAIGTSYSLSPTSKIKAELMRTHIGIVSALVDAPQNGNVTDENINIFSISYSFAF
ncbi:hypothetical protein [Acinetobacter sp.]|uniref:hypothetical protein n=1 Tax=Acinetobacter sp. TaxID=472 RepID=UPI003D01B3BB